MDDGIPKFLIISQEDRKAAWEKFRAEQKALPPEPKPTYRPISGIPGVNDDDT